LPFAISACIRFPFAGIYGESFCAVPGFWTGKIYNAKIQRQIFHIGCTGPVCEVAFDIRQVEIGLLCVERIGDQFRGLAFDSIACALNIVSAGFLSVRRPFYRSPVFAVS
jgi:hypothetical protein